MASARLGSTRLLGRASETHAVAPASGGVHVILQASEAQSERVSQAGHAVCDRLHANALAT